MFEKGALFLFPPSRGDALFPNPHDSNGRVGHAACFRRRLSAHHAGVMPTPPVAELGVVRRFLASLMNERSRTCLTASIISMTCVACAPFPSTTPVAPRSGGFVQDASTKQPIGGATVTAERAGFHASSRTSAKGFYSIPALTQWHYLIYIGSPGIAPTPWRYRDPKARYTVAASAPGYQSASQSFGPFPDREHSPFDLLIPRSVNFLLQRTKQ